jgi:hypothetical protein
MVSRGTLGAATGQNLRVHSLRAENVYTDLLTQVRPGAALGPGARGSLEFKVAGSVFTALWHVRPNAVWTCGRVFLTCPRCDRRCIRLYVPIADAGLACRRCWGLTYASRALQNYKDSLWGRGAFANAWGTTQREWSLLTTWEKRQQQQKSRDRWSARRRLLKRQIPIESVGSGAQ